MTESPPPVDSERLLVPKDDLCLDFANTRYWRGQAAPTEMLGDFDDVLKWCRASGGGPAGQRRALVESLRAQAFDESVALRELVYEIFAAIAAGKKPRAEALRALNHALAQAPPRRPLRDSGPGYGWAVDRAATRALDFLAPVLWSAGDLLVSRRLERVRRCAN